jgi:hypothetical protein
MSSRVSGTRRGVEFGGGGEWFVAWTLSFLTTAKRHDASRPALLALMVRTSTGQASQHAAIWN